MKHLVIAACIASGAVALFTSCGTSSSVRGSGADDASGPGYIEVHGTFTSTVCPTVEPIGIGPDNGGAVLLSGTIDTPPDSGVVTPTWTATSGSFADPHAVNTTFVCAGPGMVTVTLAAVIADCNLSASGSFMCN